MRLIKPINRSGVNLPITRQKVDIKIRNFTELTNS